MLGVFLLLVLLSVFVFLFLFFLIMQNVMPDPVATSRLSDPVLAKEQTTTKRKKKSVPGWVQCF